MSRCKRGDNIAIYPSGQLKAGTQEVLGGKTMVFDLLAQFPNTPVVIVELRGLMYSLASRYFTGGVQSPASDHLKEVMGRAPWRFITERVPVSVVLHAPRSLPPFPNARALNAYFEGIVNATPDYGPQWRQALRTEADVARYRFARTAEAVSATALDPDITRKVVAHLASLPEVAAQSTTAEGISPDMNLISDLGFDSLAEVELRMFAEDTFAVQIDPEVQVLTVRDLIVACQGALAETGTSEGGSAPSGWAEPNRKPPAFQEGETLAHAAIAQCYRQGLDAIYTYDATATHLIRKSKKKPLVTYRDLLTRAIMVRPCS